MSVGAIILVAVGLGMDAFAVSIAAGLSLPKLTGRHVFRMAFHFGLFQAFMPVLGWLAGATIASHIQTWDHWVAFVLLGGIGGKMVLDSRSRDANPSDFDPTRGWRLVTLSIATSIDALAVGLSLAMLRISVWAPSVVIGVVAAAMSTIGITFGSRIGHRAKRWAHLAGGLILIGIGVRIVLAHEFGI